jgi:integrase/recombinase XerD
MPIRLDTVLTKVEQMPNQVNSGLLKEFYQHMKDNGTSQNYQKGNLKAMIHFAELIGATTSFFDIDHKQVLRFLDTKIKPEQVDPDKKWITTWNDYLWRLKLFFKWVHHILFFISFIYESLKGFYILLQILARKTIMMIIIVQRNIQPAS